MSSTELPKIYQKLSEWPDADTKSMFPDVPPVAINESEYVILCSDFNDERLLKYSVDSNDWVDLSLEFDRTHGIAAVQYDTFRDTLFIVNRFTGTIRSIDLKTSNSRVIALPERICPESMVYLNEQLHVFASDNLGFCDFIHCIINLVTGDVTKQSMDKMREGKCRFSKFQRMKNCIIAYRVDRNFGEYPDRLVEYSLEKQQVVALNWSDTKSAMDCGVICTLDDRFVVRFGGDESHCLHRDGCTDQILIYDLETQTVSKSDVKCPVPSLYHAVLLGNQARDELIVFGYINQSYKDQKFRNVPSLPIHVIQMMCKWYCNESVYLLGYLHGSSVIGHWKAALDEIIRRRSPIKSDSK